MLFQGLGSVNGGRKGDGCIAVRGDAVCAGWDRERVVADGVGNAVLFLASYMMDAELVGDGGLAAV